MALPPVEPLRDQKALRHVLLAERERVDLPGRLPCGEASAKICLESGGGLVALLAGLREKVHHDRRKPHRHRRHPLARWHWLPRDMAMDPFHRIGGAEG